MRINNVNLDRLGQTAEELKHDPAKAKRVTRVEGSWNFAQGPPQFSGTLKYEGGEMELGAEMPSLLGGTGKFPGPLHYCMYGLASCYAGTFASVAAMMGVTLNKLEISAEGHFNFSRMFGLGDAPALEDVKIVLAVDSEADEQKLREVEAEAQRRCPAVYTLSHTVPLHAEVKRV